MRKGTSVSFFCGNERDGKPIPYKIICISMVRCRVDSRINRNTHYQTWIFVLLLNSRPYKTMHTSIVCCRVDSRINRNTHYQTWIFVLLLNSRPYKTIHISIVCCRVDSRINRNIHTKNPYIWQVL